MINNTSTSSNFNDELDLRKIFKATKQSKKLVIFTTLFFTLLAFIFTQIDEQKYKSEAVVVIGSFNDDVVQNVKSAIVDLKINFIHKEKTSEELLKIELLEDRLINIFYTSNSIDENLNLINRMVDFIQLKHSNFIDSKIAGLEKELELKNDKITYLEEMNLHIENTDVSSKQIISKYSEQTSISNLLNRSFKEKRDLEEQIEILNNLRKNNTQIVGEIETQSANIPTPLIIILGFILGLILSVSIALLRETDKS